MRQETCYTDTGKQTAGIILIAIGVLFLLQRLDIIFVGSIWKYWPGIFIVIGIMKLVNGLSPADTGSGLWWIFLGTWLFVSINHVWGLSFDETWPMMVIAWGVSMIWKSFTARPYTFVKE